MRKILMVAMVLIILAVMYSSPVFAHTPYYGDFRYHELDFNTLGNYKEFPQNEVEEFADAAHGNNIYVVAGTGEPVYGIGRGVIRNNPALYYSKDRRNWTKVQLSEKAAKLFSIVYGNGMFVAVGASDRVSGNERYGSYIATSKDGINWTDAVVKGSPHLTGPLSKILYVNGVFLAQGEWDGPGSGTNMLYSADGVNWKSSYAPYGGSLYTDGNKFVMLGLSHIYTSADGTNWNKVYTFETVIDGYAFDSVSLNYIQGKWKGFTTYDKIISTDKGGGMQLDSHQSVNYEIESSDLIHWNSYKIDYFMSTTESNLLGRITSSNFRVIDLKDNSGTYFLIDAYNLRYIKTKNPSDIVLPKKPEEEKPVEKPQDRTGIFIIYANNSSYRMNSYLVYLQSLLNEYKTVFGEEASLSSVYETNALSAEKKLRESGKVFGFTSESDFNNFIENKGHISTNTGGIKYQLLSIDGRLRTYSELKSILQSDIPRVTKFTYPLRVREINEDSNADDNDKEHKFTSSKELLTFFEIPYEDTLTQQPVKKGNISILTIGSPIMIVNGEQCAIDYGKNTSPVIYNGRTVLPIRVIIESFGGSVEWDGIDKVTIKLKGSIVETRINNDKAYVNGIEKILDVPPVIINGRTMVPVRFIAENLGLNVKWDEKTKSVTLTE